MKWIKKYIKNSIIIFLEYYCRGRQFFFSFRSWCVRAWFCSDSINLIYVVRERGYRDTNPFSLTILGNQKVFYLAEVLFSQITRSHGIVVRTSSFNKCDWKVFLWAELIMLDNDCIWWHLSNLSIHNQIIIILVVKLNWHGYF